MIRKKYLYDKTFTLENGQTLPALEICYHCSAGAHKGRKVVWICHALTANSNPMEWWPSLAGPGKFFDPDKYFLVCANVLGSCYGTTGPVSLDFPVFSVRDMVKAHELLREHLQIDSVDLLIGGSNGGFQALEWSISNPAVIKELCLIACNARISAWGTALNESQRMALRADPSFELQDNPEGGKTGLAAARTVALLSYRSSEGYCRTQSEDDPECFLARKACTYHQYQGRKLTDRFNAYSYYYLTLSLDTHNVGRDRGGVENALSRITARTLCIAIDSDILFPLSEMEYLTHHIPGARLVVISSGFGHDGFLLEHEQIINALCKYLNLEAAR